MTKHPQKEMLYLWQRELKMESNLFSPRWKLTSKLEYGARIKVDLISTWILSYLNW